MKSKTINPPLTATYPQADTDQVPANLGRIASALERIACAAERLSGVPQRPDLGALLRAVFEAVAERPFSCYELLDHVDVAQAADLGAAIEAAAGSRSPRRLGKLLARIEGEAVDEFRVRRVGDSREGIRWRVSRVSSEQTPARSCDGR